MAFAIAKPGQGSWTRIMTACLVAVITAATAGFVWQQATLLADKIPKTDWVLGIRLDSGAPAPGSTVELKSDAGATIGTAVIAAFKPAEQTVQVTNVQMQEGQVLDSAARFSAGGPTPLAGDLLPTPRLQLPAVEPIYVQGGMAGVVIIIGAVLAYWLVGIRSRTVDFLVATDFEMKKVNWSTPREILGSTWVVVGACVFIAIAMFVFDFIFQAFFKAIGVLAGV